MASGAMLILGGLGEIVATRAVCPLCIGAIAGGAGMIKHGLQMKKK
jgi:hypothetical protein